MSDKQQYLVLDREGVHDYTIVTENITTGLKISLFSSNGAHWTTTHRNKLLLSILNDGTCIVLNKGIKTLDYGVLGELRLLLNFEHMLDNVVGLEDKYRIIKDNSLFEI